MSSFLDDVAKFTTTYKQVLGVFIILVLAFFIIRGKSASNASSMSSMNGLLSTPPESPSWVRTLLRVVAFIVFFNGILWYVFGVDLSISLYNVFTDTAKLDIKVDTNPDALLPSVVDSSTLPRIRRKKQVFNIPENRGNSLSEV